MIPGAFTGHALHIRAILAPRSLRRDRAQGCLTGDIYPRVDAELPQDVGDMGRDGSPGQQQLGGDLRVGQTLSYERGDLGLARRLVPAATPSLAVFRMRVAPTAMSAESDLNASCVGDGTK